MHSAAANVHVAHCETAASPQLLFKQNRDLVAVLQATRMYTALPAKSSKMGSMRASTPPSRASTMPVRMMTTLVLFGTLLADASHSAAGSIQ
jgi:hypothetical protein